MGLLGVGHERETEREDAEEGHGNSSSVGRSLPVLKRGKKSNNSLCSL